MAVFAISDLHLPFGADKPMDVFGHGWERYTERLALAWQESVKAEDIVLMPGDISWATYLSGVKKDFQYLNDLNGIKIISKGNHDYWWTTLAKINKFTEENQFVNMHFLHNNAYLYEGTAICAARGWLAPGDGGFSDEDNKIYQRELIRLELSLVAAQKLNPQKIIAMLHFPPKEGFGEILKAAGVSKTVFGHVHNVSKNKPMPHNLPSGDGMCLVAADFLEFQPLRIDN